MPSSTQTKTVTTPSDLVNTSDSFPAVVESIIGAICEMLPHALLIRNVRSLPDFATLMFVNVGGDPRRLRWRALFIDIYSELTAIVVSTSSDRAGGHTSKTVFDMTESMGRERLETALREACPTQEAQVPEATE